MDSFSDVTNLYSILYNSKDKIDGFKMLVFSGDSDSVCGTVGTQHWVYNLTGTNVNTLWRNWTVLGQTAGFLTVFQPSDELDDIGGSTVVGGAPHHNITHLAFATVHKSGHEAPRYQPVNTFAMFASFINGSLFQLNETVLEMYASRHNAAHDRTPPTLTASDFVVPVVTAILVCAGVGLSLFLFVWLMQRGVGVKS